MGGMTRPRKPNRPRPRNTTHPPTSQPPTHPQNARALLSPGEETNRFLADGLAFWNEHVLRDNMPAHPPFQRQRHPLEPYLRMPSVLQHFILVNMRTLQVAKAARNPLEDHQLCHHRGLAYRGLHDLLPSASNDAYGKVLTATILALLADFGLSQRAAWEYHLQAARKIILHQGGIEACFTRLPAVIHLFTNGFLILDVLGATLREDSYLSTETVDLQLQYLRMLPSLECQLITNTDGCPQELLQYIIRITELRLKVACGASAAVTCIFQAAASLLERISGFDDVAWACKVSGYGIARPQRPSESPSALQIAAWSSLANCYKYSTLLYLVCSFHFPEKGGKQSSNAKIEHVRTSLEMELRNLFSKASLDSDGPTETQLFKLVNWPILMSLKCTLNMWSDRTSEIPQEDLNRLGMIAEATGVRSWLELGLEML